MLINKLYPVSTSEQAKNHILALVPVGHKNQFNGLLATYRNSIIKEVTQNGHTFNHTS